LGRVVSLALLLGLLAACDPTALNNGIAGRHLHVVGPWVGDEQASFMAMVKPWEDRTGNKVDYEASRDLNALLTARIQAGTPPDLAGLSGPGQMVELAKNGALLPLDRVVDLSRLKADYGQPWLRLATVNGKLVGIFIKVAIEGMMFYDPRSLASAGLDFGAPPPTKGASHDAAPAICENDFRVIRGEPRCRQSVARNCSSLHLSIGVRWWLVLMAARSPRMREHCSLDSWIRALG